MATAEELLRESILQPNPEGHIVVGGDRFITAPDNLKRLGVQYDHDMETVTFDCPRYWDGRDMSKMAIYVNYARSDNYMGKYPVVDTVRVDDVDDNIIHFDWTVSRNVTQAAGKVSFLICVMKSDADGNEERHWNSELCQDCYISPGMETEESSIESYPDLVSKLLEVNILASDVQKIYDNAVEVAETTEQVKNEAEQVKNEVLDASNYIKNSYAPAIKGAASGEVIRVDDVSPIEHEVKCRVHGKNLIDVSIVEVQATDNIYISAVGDGYIEITTAPGYTSNGHRQTYIKLKRLCPQMVANRYYVLSADTDSTLKMAHLRDVDQFIDFGKPFYVTEQMLDSYLAFYGLDTRTNATGGTCRISNIQIEEGSVATSYEHYIDLSIVTVAGCGKNVLELSGDVTHNGVTKTVDANGLITVKGTSTASININVGAGFMKAGRKYRPVIQKVKSDVVPSFWSSATQSNINKDKDGYISSEVDTDFSAFIYTASAGTVYDSAFKVMVELVTDNMTDEYEPYSGSDITPSSDGTCTVTSKYPTMTLFTDTPGVTIEAEYNCDTTKYLSSLKQDYIQPAVDAWLTNHFRNAEEVTF